ncbi:hypothetical protein C3Z13_07740 [Avibacterium endocarditidis]|uniref:Transglycosylase SLT domain-containing protein n=1 Tax=Avibacterium endocarditidis TaxID=380674 RepID=A0ABX4ZS68_9PAST|nr:hypothetical protein C3Z13_07740 [Avibacterium endocarditidis]
MPSKISGLIYKWKPRFRRKRGIISPYVYLTLTKRGLICSSITKNAKIHRTFAMAIARQESAWRANVTSSANARGLMQLLPSTAKLTAEQDQLPYKKESQLFDPIDNIMLGTTHLNQLAEKYGNNRILIAAAYNAGARRVDSWLAKSNGKLTMAEFIATIPFYETRGYVQNVLAYDYYYQLLQGEKAEKFTQAEQNRLY